MQSLFWVSCPNQAGSPGDIMKHEMPTSSSLTRMELWPPVCPVLEKIFRMLTEKSGTYLLKLGSPGSSVFHGRVQPSVLDWLRTIFLWLQQENQHR